MRTNLKNKQNGQVLLITVLIMMSTFTLAIAIGGMVLYELRSMVNTNQSTKAIYAAESGVEHKLFIMNKSVGASAPTMENGTSYECSSDCVNCIRCTGTAGRVNRAMEVSY